MQLSILLETVSLSDSVFCFNWVAKLIDDFICRVRVVQRNVVGPCAEHVTTQISTFPKFGREIFPPKALKYASVNIHYNAYEKYSC